MLPPQGALLEWLLLELRELRPHQLEVAVHLLHAFKPHLGQ